MKIRSKIIWLLITASVLIPVTFSMTIFSTRDVQRATNDIRKAQDLIDSATQLRQLVVETALFHEARSQEQWYKKMASMKLEVDAMRITSTREETDLARIQNKMNLMQVIYSRLAKVSATRSNESVPRLSRSDAAQHPRRSPLFRRRRTAPASTSACTARRAVRCGGLEKTAFQGKSFSAVAARGSGRRVLGAATATSRAPAPGNRRCCARAITTGRRPARRGRRAFARPTSRRVCGGASLTRTDS